MEIVSFGATDVGCRREKNEDYYLINTSHNLYIVADGMGGHLGGEFASKLAVSTVEEIVSGLLSDPEMTLQSNFEIKPGDYKSYLKYAINVAGSRVFERASLDPSLHGMGTTIVSAIFCDGKMFLANVGDSRCYMIRNGKIKQLTQDHSLVEEQLRAGIINPSEVRRHKLKNIITRSVGFQEEVDVDITVRGIKQGDKYFFCTDGLTNMVNEDDLLNVVSEREPRDACCELIELANRNGGDDNITVVIVKVESSDDAALPEEETAEI